MSRPICMPANEVPAVRAHRSVRLFAAATLLAALLLLTPAARAASPVVVPVPAPAPSTADPDITLAIGEQVTITAAGTASCYVPEGFDDDPCLGTSPDGAPETCTDYDIGGCIAPDLRAWSLIARTDSRPWQFVGSGPTTIVGPGRLELAYNGYRSGAEDGDYTATLIVEDLGAGRILSIDATPTSLSPRGTSIPVDGLNLLTPLGPNTGSQLATSPLRSSPLRSSPLRSSPLRSSPLRSSPLRSSPLRSSSLGSLSLAQLPLRSSPLRSSSWADLLAGTALDAPPAAITLNQVLDLDPLPPQLASLTLGDLDLARSPLRSSALQDLLLIGIPLSALAPLPGRSWCAWLRLPGDCDLSTKTLQDIQPFDFGLNELDLSVLTLAPPTDLEGSLLGNISLDDVSLERTPFAGRTDLGDYETIAELTAALPLPGLDNVTLGELLPGLVETDRLPIQLAPLSTILANEPRTTTGLLRYTLDLTAPCTLGSASLRLALPDTARYVPGSTRLTVDGTTTTLTDPSGAADASALTFQLTDELTSAPACTGVRTGITVALEVEPPAKLGSPTLEATFTVEGAPYSLRGPTNSASIDDLSDPGNTAATAGTLAPGTLRLGYLPAGDSGDAYTLQAPPVGSTVTIVLSHLPDDYDLTVTGAKLSVPSAPLRSSPLRSSPLRSSTIEDSQNAPVDGVSPIALQDLPLRSSELADTPLRSSSIQRGLDTEVVSFTVTPDDAGGSFTVRVTPYGTASSAAPYVLRAEVSGATTPPQCRTPRTLDGSVARGTYPTLPLAASTKTVFVLNQQRLAQLYPGADLDALRARLNTIAARPEVQGVVLPIDGAPGNPTRSAYEAWDANPCSVKAANEVAGSIRSLIGEATQNLDGLRNLVIIGGDAVIPQVRVPDLVAISNEREAADGLMFGGRDGAISRGMRDGFLPTDDAYGDVDPEPTLGAVTYVPDMALGRLVEEPSEITAQLQQYLDADGALSTSSAYVAGYDFLKDSAQSILDSFSLLPGSPTLLSDISETWTASDAAGALNRSTPGLSSVNAHYDHYRALPAAAFNGSDPDLLRAGQVDPAAGSLLFTAGCHAGLNVVDADQPGAGSGDAERLQDWAQQVTPRAVYIANTTYGYGDTEAVAYTERLLDLLAARLATRQVTAGQALMYAKQAFVAELIAPGVYDQKSTMALTYYGLPFFRMGAGGGEGAPALPNAPQSGAERRSSDFLVEPNLVERHPTGNTWEAYWTVGDEAPQATHGRPIQPRTTLDVTADDGLPVHGALVTELSYRTEWVSPILAQPTVDLDAHEAAAESSGGDDAFPSWIVRTTRAATSTEVRDQLVVVPGQYLFSQVLYPRIAGTVFRSHSTDYEAPIIRRTRASTEPTLANDLTLRFAAQVAGTDTTRVLVLWRTYSSEGTWQTLDLTDAGGGQWTGTVPGVSADEPNISYVVQAVDSAGNVGVSSNKGSGFPARSARTETAPSLNLDTPPSGYATGPVTVTLDPGTSNPDGFTVSIDGAPPVPYTGPFVVSGDGTHTVRFFGADGTQGSTSFRIDSAGPSVAGTPNVGASPEGFTPGPVTISWSCTDPTSGVVTTCPNATVLGSEGTGLVATAGGVTDAAENTTIPQAGPFNVDLFAPSVTVGAANTGTAKRALDLGIAPLIALSSTTTLSGTAADSLAGLRSVVVTYISTTNPGVQVSAEASLTCATADRRSCTWAAATPRQNGTWTVRAQATDRAGRITPITAPSTLTTRATALSERCGKPTVRRISQRLPGRSGLVRIVSVKSRRCCPVDRTAGTRCRRKVERIVRTVKPATTPKIKRKR